MEGYFKQVGHDIVAMTPEEIAIRQAEEMETENTVTYELINEEMNALIDAVIDLDSRLSVLEGGM